MATAWVLRVFRSRAGLFVSVGWLLLVLAVPVCLAVSFHAGFNEFYFPASRTTPLHAFDGAASVGVLIAGALAAAASSIAFALKLRAAASAIVVVTWSIVALVIPGGRLFVKPGPEHFERHVGEQVFLLPWEYVASRAHEESLNQKGFSVRLCIDSLKGAYGDNCPDSLQLRINPKDNIKTLLDFTVWSRHGSRMIPQIESRGYQPYAYRDAYPSGESGTTMYYLRKDSEGQVVRLVVCRQFGEAFCSHHAMVGNYWLTYSAPLKEGDELDGKLAALIESWRRR